MMRFWASLARSVGSLSISHRRHKRHRNEDHLARAIVEALEPRLLMSTYSITGNSTVVATTSYSLTLASSSTSISSWVINWGDGSDPDHDGVIGQTVTGTATTLESDTITHTYASGTGSAIITATATDSSGTHTAGPLALASNFGTGGIKILASGSTGSVMAASINGGFLIGTNTGFGYSVTRYLADGSVDSTFGTAGVVSYEFSSPESYALGKILSLTDGSVIVAGSEWHESGGADLVLAKYTAGGVLATGFGSGGFARSTVASSDTVYDALVTGIAATSDGHIVAAVSADGVDDESSFYQHQVVSRFSSAGVLDTAFGTSGIQTIEPTTISSPDGDLNVNQFDDALSLQSDGKILLGQTAATSDFDNFYTVVTRLTADGQIDTGFGSGGSLSMKEGGNYGQVIGMFENTDGSLLLVGQVNDYDEDGNMFFTYGTAEITSSGTSSGYSQMAGMLLTDEADLALAISDGHGHVLVVGHGEGTGLSAVTLNGSGEVLQAVVIPESITVWGAATSRAGQITVAGNTSSGLMLMRLGYLAVVEGATPVVDGASSVQEGATYTLSLSESPSIPVDQWNIDWGDGTLETVSGTAGSATHSYGIPGSRTISATLTTSGVTSEPVTKSVEVTSALSISPGNIHPIEGQTFSDTSPSSGGYAATFTDADPAGVANDFSATIDWGDGSEVSTGRVVADGGGTFHVVGSHLFASGVPQPIVHVEVSDSATDETISTDTTVTIAPTTPLFFTASNHGSQEIDLVFQSYYSTVVTDMEIERSTDGVSFSPLVSWQAGPETVKFYNDTNLAPSSTYYYRARFLNNGVASQWSETQSVTTSAYAFSNGTFPLTVNEGSTLALSAFANYANPAIVWDLDGDGNFGETGAAAANGDEVGPNVTFNATDLDGDQTINVTARSTAPDSSVLTFTDAIEVMNVAPALTISGSSTIKAHLPYVLSLSSSDPGADTISSWTITWGDGTITTVQGNPSSAIHNYAAAGNFSIAATATDEDGTYAAPSLALDTTFGGGGTVTDDHGQTARLATTWADGTLLIASFTSVNSFEITKYHADGNVDTSFSGGSRSYSMSFSTFVPSAITALSGGAFLVTGTAQSGTGKLLIVTRYNSDGTRDTSFGSGGTTSVNISSLGDYEGFLGTVLTADGHINVSARTVVTDPDSGNSTGHLILWRLDAAGVAQSSFGLNGVIDFSSGVIPGNSSTALAVGVDQAGRVLFATNGPVGNDYWGPSVGRLLWSGALDSTFGTGGILTLPDDAGTPSAFLRLADGSSILASMGSTGSQGQLQLLKLLADGTVDQSFAAPVVAMGDGGGSGTSSVRLMLLEDGSIGAACTLGSGQSSFVVFDGEGNAGVVENGALVAGEKSTAGLAVVQADGRNYFVSSGQELDLGHWLNAGVQFARAGYLSVEAVSPTWAGVSLTGLTAQQSTGTVTLGWFSDASSTEALSSFQAIIDWGDGTSPTVGTVVSSTDPAYDFSVEGGHTYAVAGSYTITIHVSVGNGAAALDLTGGATVGAATISTPVVSGPTDIGGGNTYTLTLTPPTNGGPISGWNINWGDGSDVEMIPVSQTTAVHTYPNNPHNYRIVTTAITLNSLDSLFGSGGVRQFSNLAGHPYALHMLDSGKFLVAGDGTAANTGIIARFNADGTLDTTFGTDGWTALPNSGGHAVVVLPTDGTIVVGGGSQFATTHLTADGAIISHALGQYGTSPLVASYTMWDMAVQSDGKIIAVGDNSDLVAILRFNADGSPDTTFGDGTGSTKKGGFRLNFGGTGHAGHVYAVTLQSDGKIVFVGSATVTANDSELFIARLTSSGQLDTSFGASGSGYRIITNSSHTSEAYFTVTADAGGFIVAGNSGSLAASENIVLTRYTATGAIDTTFNGGMSVNTDFAGGEDGAYSVTVLANGRIVIAGKATQNGKLNFAVARYLSDGTIDSSFGTGGKVITSISSGTDMAESAAVTSDGDLLVAGVADGHFALAKYFMGVDANEIDVMAHGITGVTGIATWNTLYVGFQMNFYVNFAENVTVTGTPILLLNSGGIAYYNAAASTASSLAFHYVVAAPQMSSRLDYLSANALVLPSGSSIHNAASGVAEDLTLPWSFTQNTSFSNGNVTVDSHFGQSVIGAVDGGTVYGVTGWAYDPDDATQAVRVTVTVVPDNANSLIPPVTGVYTASTARPASAGLPPIPTITGNTIDFVVGPQGNWPGPLSAIQPDKTGTLQVTAHNIGPGSDQNLLIYSSPSNDVDPSYPTILKIFNNAPGGYIDLITGTTVSGRAEDADAEVAGVAESHIWVDVYVDGVFHARQLANLARADDTINPANHGFSFDLSYLGLLGNHRIQVFAEDSTAIVPGTSNQHTQVELRFAQPASTEPGFVSGIVFSDVDGDGQRGTLPDGSLERIVPNATVYLDLNHNNELDDDEPRAVSDAHGNYRLQAVVAGSPLAPGSYDLRVAGVPDVLVTVTVALNEGFGGINVGIPSSDPQLSLAISSEGLPSLSWTDNLSNAGGYDIYRKGPTESGFTLLDTTAAGVQSYVDNSADFGVAYMYYVMSRDANSTQSNVVTVNPPSAIPWTVSGNVFLDQNQNHIWDNQLIHGQTPTIVFVFDDTTSTQETLDNTPATISRFEATKEAFIALEDQILALGYGNTATVSIVKFDPSDTVDMSTVLPGKQLSTFAGADLDHNGIPDVIDALNTLDDSNDTGSSYPNALNQVMSTLGALGTAPGDANVFLVTDGGNSGDVKSQIQRLRDWGDLFRAFIVGPGGGLDTLETMDPNAMRLLTPSDIQGVFGGVGLGNAPEPGMAGQTVVLDVNGDGHYEAGVDQTTVTDASGHYSFTGFGATNTAHVLLTVPAGYVQTSPWTDTTTGGQLLSLPANLSPGDDITDLNLGLHLVVPPPTISSVAVTNSLANAAPFDERSAIKIHVDAAASPGQELFYSVDANGNGIFTDPGDIYRSTSPDLTFFIDDGVQDNNSNDLSHHINVQVSDDQGNITSYPSGVIVNVKNVPPTVTLQDAPDTVDVSDTAAAIPVSFTWSDPSFADAVSGVQYSWALKNSAGITKQSGPGTNLDHTTDAQVNISLAAPTELGSYTLTVTVTDKDLDSTTISKSINVIDSHPELDSITSAGLSIQPPDQDHPANYYIDVTSAQTGFTLNALAKTLSNQPESTIGYRWSEIEGPPLDGGNALVYVTDTDGTSGTNAAKQAGMQFDAAGRYVFDLTLSNDLGNQTSYPIVIDIQQGFSGLQIVPSNSVFDGNGRLISADLTAIELDQFGDPMSTTQTTNWAWTIQSGGGSVSASTNNESEFTAPASGDSTVVHVSHDSGHSADVTIALAPSTLGGTFFPQASTTPNPDPRPRLIANFTDTGSTDPTAYSATVSWGDGTTAAGTVAYDSEAQIFDVFVNTKQYAASGSYTVGLHIARGSSPTLDLVAPVTVTVPPVHHLVLVSMSKFTPFAGYTFKGTVGMINTDDPDYDPSVYSISIDWGDQTSSTIAAPARGANNLNSYLSINTSHLYATAGPYTVTMNVLKNGSTAADIVGSTSETITVADSSQAKSLPLSGSGAVMQVGPLGAVGSVDQPVLIASFQEALSDTVSTDYTATIRWLSFTVAADRIDVITSPDSPLATVNVYGHYNYGPEETNYQPLITLVHKATNRIATATATILVSAEESVGYNFQGTAFVAQRPFSGTLVTLTSLTDISSVTIDWGNDAGSQAATVSPGTLTNTFDVSGDVTYTSAGQKTITVLVHFVGGASQSITEQITVAAYFQAPVISTLVQAPNHGIGIVWTRVPDAAGYVINQSIDNGPPQALTGNKMTSGASWSQDPSKLYYISQQLPPNVKVTYTVQAVFSNGSFSPVSNALSTTTPALVQADPPSEPTGVEIEDGTHQVGAQLTWTSDPTARGYLIFRKVGSSWQDILNPTNPAIAVAGDLDVGSIAAYVGAHSSVNVIAGDGQSGQASIFDPWTSDPDSVEYTIVVVRTAADNSNTFGIATIPVVKDSTPPSVPTGLAGGSFPQAIQLTWDDRAESDTDWAGWIVYRKVEGADSFTRLTASPITLETGYNDYTAQPGQTYIYEVKAVDGFGNESEAASIDVRRAIHLAPPAPTDFFAIPTIVEGHATAQLSWSAVVPPQDVLAGNIAYTGDALASYEIQRFDGGSWHDITPATLGTSTTMTDSNVTLGVTYQYRIATRDQDSDLSPWTITSLRLPDVDSLNVPPAPTVGTITRDTNSISLNWTMPAGFEGSYRIYRSLSQMTGFTALVETSQASFVDESLHAGTNFYYRIYAIASTGEVSAPLSVASSTLTVAGVAPTVRLTSPNANATISKDTVIRGLINNPTGGTLSWTVTARNVDTGDGTTLFIGTTETPVGADAALGTLSPTLLANGLYELQLSATNSTGTSESGTELVQISTNVKVGNFTLPITDLNATFGGTSVTVSRTYDSSTADHKGDLGYGWTLNLNNVTVTTTAPPASGVNPLRSQDVMYITLPGQGQFAFQFLPRPHAYSSDAAGALSADDPTSLFFVGQPYTPQFISIDGSGATLTIDGPVPSLIYDANDQQFLQGTTPYDPTASSSKTSFILTTADGTRYKVQAGKLVSSTDTNGNQISYSDNGISTSYGDQLVVTRNNQNLVTSVTFHGQTVRYTYTGDLLTSVTGTNGVTTSYVYDDVHNSHLLTKVQSARSETILTVSYDPSGKVVAVTDAANQSAPFNYTGFNGTSGSVASTDFSGSTTEQVFDDHGNVVREIQTIYSGDQITGYLVTGHAYDYYNYSASDLHSAVADGTATMNLLLGETDYAPITIFGADNAGARYTDAFTTVTHTTSYYVNTPGEPNGALASESTLNPVKDGDPITYTVTTYSGYVDGKPATIVTTIVGPNGTPITITSQTSNVYDTAGNLVQSTNAVGEITHYVYSIPSGTADQHHVVAVNLPAGLLIDVIKQDDNGSVVMSQNTYYTDGALRGLLKSTVDANGISTVYSYDGNGNTLGVQRILPGGGPQPKGSTTTYDPITGRVTSQTDEAGNTTTTAYDDLGRVSSTTDASGTTLTFYDNLGNVIQTQSPDGTVTRTTYDVMNRPVWSTGAFNPASSILPTATFTFYDSLGRAYRTDTYANVQLDFTIPNAGYPDTGAVSLADPTDGIPAGATWMSSTVTTYDAQGRPATVSDYTTNTPGTGAANKVTTTSYFTNGQVDTVTVTADGDSTSTSYTYGGTGSSLPDNAISFDTVTDARGKKTTTYKDILGRTVRTLYADGSFTETLYSTNGQPITRSDLTAPTDGAGGEGWPGIATGGSEVVQIAQRQTGETPQATYYLYDASGNLTDVWLPATHDASHGGALARAHWHYGYTNGNQTSQTDPNGHTTSFTYDPLGRQTSRTLPDGEKQTTTYDSLGNIVVQKFYAAPTNGVYGNAYLTLWSVYDTTPGHTSRLLAQYRYTLDFNPTTGADPEATPYTEKTVYTYDDVNLGRLLQVADYVHSGDAVRQTHFTAYTYDNVTGAVSSILSSEGDIQYVYDPHTGQHTETKTANNDQLYTYNNRGQLTTVTVKKLNGQTLATPEVTSYTYDDNGNLKTVSQPDGVTTTYTYDALNRLTDESAAHGSTLVFTEHYTLNSDGLRSSVTDTRYTAAGSVLWQTQSNWTYDAAGRLLSEELTIVQTGAGVPSTYKNTFDFDLAGNRKDEFIDSGDDSTTDTPITYTYSGDDQLLTETATGTGAYVTTYTYDAAGDQTSSHRTGTNPSDSTYTWDLRNRMIAATIDGVTTTYTYDENGVRTSETAAGQTTTYLNDPYNPTGYTKAIEEKSSPTGPATRSFVLGLKVEGQSTQTDASGPIDYYLTDGHGSTRALIDLSGTTAQSYDYDAFGKALTFNPNTALTPWLFAGDGLYDPATGWTYQLARWRDGFRFTSMDTYGGDIQSPPTLHRYLYDEANAINGIDPSGHLMIPAGLTRFFAKFGAIDTALRVLIGIRATYVLGDAYRREVNDVDVDVNRQIISEDNPSTLTEIAGFYDWATGTLLPKYRGRPDIVDKLKQRVYEIKAEASAWQGLSEVNYYIQALNEARPDAFYLPGTWQPREATYDVVGLYGIPVSFQIHAENIGNGVIAYAVTPPPELVAALFSISAKAFGSKVADSMRLATSTAIGTLLGLLGFV